jgi:hypothetical protein
MLTTLPSMKAIAEARMVAANTNGRDDGGQAVMASANRRAARPSGAIGLWVTASPSRDTTTGVSRRR